MYVSKEVLLFWIRDKNTVVRKCNVQQYFICKQDFSHFTARTTMQSKYKQINSELKQTKRITAFL